jgi:predicted dehydrogenase
MSNEAPVRFGLVGTGYWARETHATGIDAANGAELTAVWGRNPAAAREIADRYGATVHEDFDEFLSAVDAVSFSVPPDVQAPLVIRAAQAGKHMLMEKPIALDDDAAGLVVEAVGTSGVAALVFFTHLFSPPVVQWFDEVADGSWSGGSAQWLGSALADENPFNTPWRRRYGGLWDVGPHAVVDLLRTLGRVTDVVAESGGVDVTHLILRHESGATSTATLTISAPDAADGFTMMLWGASGRTNLPIEGVDSPVALTGAIEQLVSMICSGERNHAADVYTGRAVHQVLSSAQRQLDAKAAR